MMKKLARQLPAYAVGVYLATGLMDEHGIRCWGGQQWAAAVLAGVIIVIGSWACGTDGKRNGDMSAPGSGLAMRRRGCVVFVPA